MLRILIGLVVVGILVLGAYLYFSGSEEVADTLNTSPTPTVQGQVNEGELPQALSSSFASTTSRKIDGSARISRTPDNKLLATIMFNNEPTTANPIRLVINQGSCDSIGEAVAPIATTSRVYHEEVIDRPMSEVWSPGESRIIVLRDRDDNGDVLGCGNLVVADQVETLTLPTLDGAGTPAPKSAVLVSPSPATTLAPDHDPINTAGFPWDRFF